MYKLSVRQLAIAFASLAGGLAAGSLALYATIRWLTESPETAILFTAPAVAFFIPVVAVFALAAFRFLREPSPQPSVPSPGTKLAAAAYALCIVPFWFASVGAVQGRIALAVVLFLVYALSAYFPLRAAYPVRLWANAQPSPK